MNASEDPPVYREVETASSAHAAAWAAMLRQKHHGGHTRVEMLRLAGNRRIWRIMWAPDDGTAPEA